MSDSKSPISKKEMSEEIVTINIQPFIMPVTIILSALIIALGTFFGLNNIANSLDGTTVKTTSGSTTDTTGNTDTTGTTGDTTGTATVGKTDVDDDPYLGDKGKAKVAIVEFVDYECVFCHQFHVTTFSSIKSDYIDSGKAIFVARDFPIPSLHPGAETASIAAQCVFKLSKNSNEAYFKFIDSNWGAFVNGVSLTSAQLSDFASKAGVNKGDFESCVSKKETFSEIDADRNEGTAAGVNGTPAFIVGKLNDDGTVDGELVSGAQPYSVFQQAIERQLAK